MNTGVMKHTTPTTKIYLDDMKPNPITNIDMLPSNNRIIEIISIVYSYMSPTPLLKFFMIRLFLSFSFGLNFYHDKNIFFSVDFLLIRMNNFQSNAENVYEDLNLRC